MISMFAFDKTIKNIMGRHKSQNNYFGKSQLPTFKPIQTNISMNMLNRTQYKPASPRMQMQWKGLTHHKKILCV
jgi:hypothetical protein